MKPNYNKKYGKGKYGIIDDDSINLMTYSKKELIEIAKKIGSGRKSGSRLDIINGIITEEEWQLKQKKRR